MRCHCAQEKTASQYATQQLGDAFGPGGLTKRLKKNPIVPNEEQDHPKRQKKHLQKSHSWIQSTLPCPLPFDRLQEHRLINYILLAMVKLARQTN